LGGKQITAPVSNVTLQGLERMQPVLHFRRLAKRMVLDDAQSDAMARITGQAVLEAWIGARVTLSPAIDEAGHAVIHLAAAHEGAGEAHALPAPPRQAPQLSWRQPLLLMLLLGFAFAAVYLVENGTTLWAEAQALFEGF
jgi:hypothetical protein